MQDNLILNIFFGVQLYDDIIFRTLMTSFSASTLDAKNDDCINLEFGKKQELLKKLSKKKN